MTSIERHKNSDDQNGMIVTRQEASFSGPLPHPTILKQYDEIVSGAAERIIKMAEEQFSHRTSLERKVIDSDIQRSKIGQILGFIIAIAGLAVALIVTLRGYETAGILIGGATLVSLVGVFVYGTASRKREREEKGEE